MAGFSSGSADDYSRAIEKNPTFVSDMDFNKGVRKATVQPADEGIIDGVTHDSIAEFVASRENDDKAVRDVPTGFFGRLKALFGR